VSYLRSKRFWKLIAILSAGTAVFYLVFFWVILPLLTRQGEEVILADLTSKPYARVRALLEERGFAVEVIDSIYKPDVPPMVVVGQDPLPGTRIKKGRKIYLTLSSYTPPQVPFPRVEGLPYDQVYRLLTESYGFSVGEVIAVPGEVSDVIREARYKGERLAPGTLVPKYSRIDLVVVRSEGLDKVPLVKVVGLPLAEAMARLSAAGLSVGQIRYKPNPSYPPGIVFQQYPQKAPGDSLSRGYPVDLFVSGEPPKQVAE
jgi:beta-lactam-binding protein with PASTA domain